jgi:hypothetical protein
LFKTKVLVSLELVSLKLRWYNQERLDVVLFQTLKVKVLHTSDILYWNSWYLIYEPTSLGLLIY